MAHCPNDTYEEWRECLKEFMIGKPFTTEQVIIFSVAYGIVTAMGLMGNGLVIYVVLHKREMRTTRNVFIMNLALSNFLLAIIWIPFLWIPSFQVEFNYNAFFCKVAQAFPGINIYCSTLTISVIAIDRYFVIARSQVGPDKLKMIQAVLIAICIWIVAFALSVPYLLFFDIERLILPEELTRSFGFGETFLYQQCAFEPPQCSIFKHTDNTTEYRECIRMYDGIINISLVTFLYVIPILVLVVFNFLLSVFLKKSERQTIALRHRTLQCLNSNPRIDNRGRRNRTTALLIVMAVSYAVLWFPFISFTLYLHLMPGLRDRPNWKVPDEACKLISMLSICVNPFLYGYLNTNFNREFKIIFSQTVPFVRHSSDRRYSRPSVTAQTSGFTLVTRDSDSTPTCHISRSWLVRMGSKGKNNDATPV